jgi:hypothetical protein
MFEPYMVIIRLATRKTVGKQLLGLIYLCFTYVLYKIYTCKVL